MFVKKIVPKNDIKKFLKRFQSFHPKLIDLSLERVERLLDALNNPQDNLPPVIHIAGTNGKGSTLSFIKSGLEAEKKLVHTYTSPHLIKFNERICIKGKEINDTKLREYFSRCEDKNNNSKITLFEITTCAAFLAFSESEADYTLLEVGLGGKFDATNVIKNPVLTIITPISLDHEQYLGENLIQIADAKAGVLKPNTPAIIGRQERNAMHRIREVAKQTHSPLHIFGYDWLSYKKDNRLIFEDNNEILELAVPSLVGDHQYENAGMAVAALKYLNVSKSSINSGIENAIWPARLQKLNLGPYVSLLKELNFNGEIWVDGGHNDSAATAITNFLKSEQVEENHVICGMINSKDVDGFLRKFANVAESFTAIRIPEETNSHTIDKIYSSAERFFINSYKANSLHAAIENVCKTHPPQKSARIMICGSLYLSGYVLRNHS